MGSEYTFTNSLGDTYYLHGMIVNLRNGRKQQIYFFSREVREGVMEELPAGFEASETVRSHMPVLRKIRL